LIAAGGAENVVRQRLAATAEGRHP
jgi:hypothetical protein